MPRLTPHEKREALIKKRAELDAQLRTIEAQQRQADRKRDTRRKVVAGAIVLEHLAQYENDAFSIKLRELLGKYIDARSRDLFPFLPALPAGETTKSEPKGSNGTLASGEFERHARKELEPRESATATG